MKSHISQLRKLGACFDAITYAEKYDTAQEAWDNCERGDWLAWLIGKTINCGPWTDGRKPFLACMLDCADTVADLRPKKQVAEIAEAIKTLRLWIDGKATQAEAQTARQSLYDASAAAYDAYDAYAAAAAAYDASAASATAYGARTKKLKECAEIVRKHYPNPPMQED